MVDWKEILIMAGAGVHCTDSKNQQPYSKARDFLQNVWLIILLLVRFCF